MTNANQKKNNLFVATDLYAVAFLKATGSHIVDIIRDSGGNSRRKVTVKFLFTIEAEQRILDFHNGEEIPAVRFAAAIDEIKSLIFNYGS